LEARVKVRLRIVSVCGSWAFEDKAIQPVLLMAQRHTFSRPERLKSPERIARLFKEGESFLAYPLRIVWMALPDAADAPMAQAAFSVSKRTFRSAVARNQIKRRMREAYRLHKAELYAALASSGCPPLELMVLYIAREPLSYAEIGSGMAKVIRKLPKGCSGRRAAAGSVVDN
jgi:ribonuclease P protein component